MPVEFRCTGCAKFLRTPDESAGKKAKCPECGEIVDVPLTSQAEDELVASAPRGASAGVNPFGDPTAVTGQRAESANPYAAPTTNRLPHTSTTRFGDLEHHIISFDEVVRMVWTLTRRQLGPLALCGLAYLPIIIGIRAARWRVGEMSGAVNDPFFQIAGPWGFYVVEFCVTTYLQLGLVIFSLRLVRTGTARVSDLFAGGPIYRRGLGLFFLIMLIYYGAMVVCQIPAFAIPLADRPAWTSAARFVCVPLAVCVGIYVQLRMALACAFLVDRDTGVLESLRLSDQFMTGNKTTALLLTITTVLVGVIAVAATCFVGILVVAPVALGVLYCTIYILATGQATYDAPPQV